MNTFSQKRKFITASRTRIGLLNTIMNISKLFPRLGSLNCSLKMKAAFFTTTTKVNINSTVYVKGFSHAVF